LYIYNSALKEIKAVASLLDNKVTPPPAAPPMLPEFTCNNADEFPAYAPRAVYVAYCAAVLRPMFPLKAIVGDDLIN